MKTGVCMMHVCCMRKKEHSPQTYLFTVTVAFFQHIFLMSMNHL